MAKAFVVSDLIETRNEGMITVLGVPDRPGVAAKLFSILASAEIPVHTIVQNSPDAGSTTITFTIGRADFDQTLDLCRDFFSDLAEGLIPDPEIARVSIIGSDMEDSAGVASSLFELMASSGINILTINASHHALSILIKDDDCPQAMKVLRSRFIIQG